MIIYDHLKISNSVFNDMQGGVEMKRAKLYTLDLLVICIVFLPYVCCAGIAPKQTALTVENHRRPVVVEKTGQDGRPNWTTKQTFCEQDGAFVYTGGVMGGADYALTLRLARSEATKNLLESIQIKARSEFSSAIHGQNRTESDLGRYVTDAVAWTVDNIKISGIRQHEIYCEKILDPISQSLKYSAWVQVEISRSDYVKAKTDAAQRLLEKAIQQKDEEAAQKVQKLLKRLR
ncbi:conserved domain protein [delta proteobacterium NaphS2]|nr:conserved domain protein [delta proteobacterium NaphS2]